MSSFRLRVTTLLTANCPVEPFWHFGRICSSDPISALSWSGLLCCSIVWLACIGGSLSWLAGWLATSAGYYLITFTLVYCLSRTLHALLISESHADSPTTPKPACKLTSKLTRRSTDTPQKQIPAPNTANTSSSNLPYLLYLASKFTTYHKSVQQASGYSNKLQHSLQRTCQ